MILWFHKLLSIDVKKTELSKEVEIYEVFSELMLI